MEVRILQLGLGLLLLVAHNNGPIVAAPSPPQCPRQCGNVEIQYPFGIGMNCSLGSDFNVSCEVQDGVSKPFIMGGFELLNISLTDSTIRVLNNISSYCYNPSSGLMENNTWGFHATNTSYRFSDVRNKFTIVGCSTLAYIYDFSRTCYQSGCISTCGSLSDLTDGFCSGMGCCQTSIPRDMDYYNVNFDSRFNTSQISHFSRCSYAVLMEATAFNFSTAYISTTRFNDTNAGRAPTVLDWAIRNGTVVSCEEAKRNETGTYACLSSNSECVNSTNGPGYMCNCNKGYQGNPYLLDGCQGTDST
jgi:hypothetical protein